MKHVSSEEERTTLPVTCAGNARCGTDETCAKYEDFTGMSNLYARLFFRVFYIETLNIIMFGLERMVKYGLINGHVCACTHA